MMWSYTTLHYSIYHNSTSNNFEFELVCIYWNNFLSHVNYQNSLKLIPSYLAPIYVGKQLSMAMEIEPVNLVSCYLDMEWNQLHSLRKFGLIWVTMEI